MIGAPASVAEQIIGLERAPLGRWGKGDPSGFLDICAPDVVYSIHFCSGVSMVSPS